MAVLDTDTNEIVLRVVYDGPPEAGKTTSLRSLAGSFAQATQTPEEDATGRTLWFDWMEYVGGRFEGNSLRCQIVSVPGQRELQMRRKALLASADVVVFVADSTAARWDVSLEYLLELRRLLPEAAQPIGIVLQANKRDAADAVPLAALKLRLGEARWTTGLVESIAADGTGIREAFVYAVRLALDRVREQIADNSLPKSRHAGTSPVELLAELQQAEHRPLFPPPPPPIRMEDEGRSLAAQLFRDVIEAEARAIGIETIVPETLDPNPLMDEDDDDLAIAVETAFTPIANAPPLLPDATVPSGAIWPPVEGRAILYEISQLTLSVRSLANGDWRAGLGSGWRIVSAKDAVYDTLDAGRSALVQWARLHAAFTSVVSLHRCIVLAASGDGHWRLWQVVRAESSLREFVVDAASEPTPDLAVQRLCQTAQLLVDLNERIAELPYELPISLDTVGQVDATAMFIGLMPPLPISERPITTPRLSSSALLSTELGPVLALDLADVRDDLGRALERLPQRFVHADAVVASLTRMLS